MDSAKQAYREGFHWTSVLNHIPNMDAETASALPGTSAHLRPTNVAIRGQRRMHDAAHAELVARIPPRTESDRLVAYYFEVFEYSPIVLHRGEFMFQYKAFWHEPASAQAAWLGLLRSVLHLVNVFRSTQPATSKELSHARPPTENAKYLDEFKDGTAQALNLAQDGKEGRFIIQTLIHYFFAHQYLKKDSSLRSWLLFGNIIQIALCNGYHRDPDQIPHISPFEGEIRRRLWSFIYQADMASCAQLGMPRLIRDSIVDTREPRNLFDEDFSADTTILPTSRPETHLTPILITIVKQRFSEVCSEILDLVTSRSQPSYESIMEVDQKLSQTQQRLPERCRFRSMTDSILDSPSLVFQLIFIDLSFSTMRINLHSRHLPLSRLNPDYSYSRDVSVEAACHILARHHLLEEEFLPGGRLSRVKWLSFPLLLHIFLLACGILCSHLSQSAPTISHADLDKITHLLKTTQSIWTRASEISSEARKASAILSKILGQLEQPGPQLTGFGFGDISLAGPSLDGGDTSAGLPLEFGDIDPMMAKFFNFGPDFWL
ncbi:hypothetical protein B0I35DRAFT_434398 [Stachybotrys elegans]|uniref:Xylanolytic transcriptional activator regulatory domain-containing protein n=1 Tax=Stachybotrys elegans TaxID=80388 RepID=A0A8K0WQ87_9HYPO|nr:hypothetical protein B0I35DRAFT_434398 [Stachybotrys elegans]